ncbi:MAG: hypothetical protein U5M53_06025 [Rhodoferax sp.]|nr:hypothetical protein [Rhodoferax sp.]
MSAVLESVSFRLTPGANASAFVEASAVTFSWVRQQPGFVHRVLSCHDSGEWSDQVLWQSKEQAQSASHTFMQTFGDSAFMALMDPETVHMQHTPVLAHA